MNCNFNQRASGDFWSIKRSLLIGLSVLVMAVFFMAPYFVYTKERNDAEVHSETISCLQSIENALACAELSKDDPQGPYGLALVPLNSINRILKSHSVKEAYILIEAENSGYINLRIQDALIVKLQDGQCWNVGYGNRRKWDAVNADLSPSRFIKLTPCK